MKTPQQAVENSAKRIVDAIGKVVDDEDKEAKNRCKKYIEIIIAQEFKYFINYYETSISKLKELRELAQKNLELLNKIKNRL